MRVDGTGTGFLLMHRDALETVAKAVGDPAAPWFREMPGQAPLALLAEDLTFCLRCRLAEVPVHVHTGVRIGHMKPVMLGEVDRDAALPSELRPGSELLRLAPVSTRRTPTGRVGAPAG